MGNGSVIRPGELQLMRAGTRASCTASTTHSATDPVHFLQIWVVPADQDGLEPAYDAEAPSASEERQRPSGV